MKLISAVVLPSRVARVKHALELFGVRGLTLSNTFTRSDASTPVEMYRGVVWQAALVPRVRMEVLAADADTEDLVRVIARAANPAGNSPAEIWVIRVDLLVRIRTGEWGLAAL